MYYHMYGSGIGSLNVSTQDQDLWSLVGEQGNRWQQAFVSIPPQTTMVRRSFLFKAHQICFIRWLLRKLIFISYKKS